MDLTRVESIDGGMFVLVYIYDLMFACMRYFVLRTKRNQGVVYFRIKYFTFADLRGLDIRLVLFSSAR